MQPLILTVDDDPASRYSIGRLLQLAGFRVEEAGTGEDALRAARHNPDAIVLDISLPDIDGLEVCRRLKRDPSTAPIPVLHLTSAHGSSEHWAAALEAGADAFLNQPVEPAVLVATLKALLRARAAEAEVRTGARLWQNTFDAITSGVAVLDASSRVLRCNRSMALFLGKSPVELAGSPAIPPLPGADVPEGGWPYDRARESRQRESTEVKAGERWFEVISDPILDERGAFNGTVRIVTDVTDRKRAEAEKGELLRREQAARAEAEAANRLKDDFLATLSHELRTPLHAIMGWSHVLRSSWPDEATFRRAVDTIDRNARAQEQLVADILDVSRIVTGKLRLETEALELAAVVDAALATVAPAAEAKGVTIETRLDRGAGSILGDRDRLQQVAWNLLSNAIKFTPAGGRVEVRLARREDGLELTVEDTGTGIDPALLPHVFDRFRQADSSTTRKHGGLGLGLALVRHLVELHGGTAHAESDGLGAGSRFAVRLPLVSGAQPRTPTGAGALAKTPLLTGIRVLLVEDDADAREGLALILRGRGARVTSAASTREALEAMEREIPDVVVADIGMPDEDGYALIAKVRSRTPEAGGGVPAIALSGYATPEDRTRALIHGFEMHVAKPLHFPELVVAISSLAHSHPR